jgi:hypothetical protein
MRNFRNTYITSVGSPKEKFVVECKCGCEYEMKMHFENKVGGCSSDLCASG